MSIVQKHRHVVWAKAHIKLTVSKWKIVLWPDESKFDVLVVNHGHHVLRAKEEEVHTCGRRTKSQVLIQLNISGVTLNADLKSKIHHQTHVHDLYIHYMDKSTGTTKATKMDTQFMHLKNVFPLLLQQF